MLIVLERHGTRSQPAPALLTPQESTTTSHVLLANWQIELVPVSGKPQSLTTTSLIDPLLARALEGFAGSVTCKATVKIDRPQTSSLEVGVLHGVSELWVNGQPLGVRWFGNQSYDLRAAAVPGANELTFRLTTTLGNFVKTLKSNRTAMDWSEDTPTYNIGFTGNMMVKW
jgi:hypothetical protein